MSPEPVIRSYSKPACLICGITGDIVYEGLQDHLFDAPGNWNLKRCSNPSCGLIWLDPCPISEDIGKLYLNYYTHQHNGAGPSEENRVMRKRTVKNWSYSLIKRMILIRRSRRLLNDMYLSRTRQGRLLELGCGDGRRLLRLKKKGWTVEGQEIDNEAIANTRSRIDAPIHEGELVDLDLDDNTYDAVVLNHVIEHVENPVGMLHECRRILKPGGRLVVTTPNTDSYGHKHFRSQWRGLEPPRHLHLFNCKNLFKTGQMAGFERLDVWSTAAKAETFAAAGLSIRKNGFHHMRDPVSPEVRSGARAFQIRATLLKMFRSDSGEECVLVGYK